ncbi:hypothetical protein O181_063012, partial [Austropuccinia psidii MF-1]|nr:hypothetical protein [Austropuccinia psidii MF-1]
SRPLEKLHELLADCKKASGLFQYLKVTQWMAFIDGKEEHDAFNSKLSKKPSTMQTGAKISRTGQKQLKVQKLFKGKAPAPKPYIQGYRIPNIQQDDM